VTTFFRLRSEPSGTAYELLLRYLLQKESAYGVVWREQLKFTEEARHFGDVLGAYRLSRRRTDHWPGTQLGRPHLAVVETYRCDIAALPILRAPGSLFAWRSPKYPEDLHFLSSSGVPSLITVAHEQYAWIASDDVARDLSQLIPLEKEEVSEDEG